MEPGLLDDEDDPADDFDLHPEHVDGDPIDPARPPRPHHYRQSFQFTTQGMMIAVAVFAVEGVILVEAHRMGPGIEFTLFIGSVLGVLDFLVPGYLGAAERINSAPPERQTAELLNVGCLLFLIGLFLVPISLVILLRNGGR